LTPHAVPTWEGVGTDEMRFARKRLTMPAKNNRPSLNGADVSALDYSQEITSGFADMYRLLERHRDELAAPDGPLARFAGDPVRCIVRPTQTYGMLLAESFHPNLLRNALDRERFLDHLWVGVEANPVLRKLLAQEREDLLRGDIPQFSTRPGSRELWGSTGQAVVGCLDEPGLCLVRGRLAQIGEEDRARQEWFIRSALTALAIGDARARPPSEPAPASSAPATREQLLAAARAVGDRLEELALRDGSGEVGWIGLTLLQDQFWTLTPAGLDLYSGLPGIGLFLVYLGAVAGEPRYTRLAQDVCATVRRHVGELRSAGPVPIGAFGALGGTIYFVAHAGVVWDDAEVFSSVDDVVAMLPPLIDGDEHLDVISGAAGCLASLLAALACRPGEALRAAAVRCGERLLARAEPAGRGAAWTSRIDSRGPLTGFSHGAAGMAWALFELAALTGEEKFREAARRGLAYERGLFSVEMQNWPDLRRFAGEPATAAAPPSYAVAWCHGAPGIGLGRLRTLRCLDDSVLGAEVDAALRTTLTRGFGANHCLCHGDLGNLDFVLQAAEAFADAPLRARVDRLAAGVLASITRHGWRCGAPGGVETPGLMVGLAGIGYGLLRLAEPARVPPVLVMAPPAKR
jgi:type 2 lantibiotic biosynthesis protein LanM